MTRVQGGETSLAPLGGLFLQGAVAAPAYTSPHLISSADPIPHQSSIPLTISVSGVVPWWYPTLGLLLSMKTPGAEPLQNCHPRLGLAKYRP